MKKIVALVLSLVMVLGLATTAFGAVAEYKLWDSDDTDSQTIVTRTKVSAKALTETRDGQVACWKLTYEDDSVAYFVEITKAEATNADFYLTKAADDDAIMYLRSVKNAGVYTLTGTEVKNYVDPDADEECLQWRYDGITEKVYVDAEGDFYVTGTGKFMLVDGVVIEVEAADAVNELVWHEMEGVYDAKDKLVGVKCLVCGATGTVYASEAKAPLGATTFDIDGTAVYVMDAVKAPAAESDKVESAETFDAGIAMYVGMSVMAAAGSAVVLKKKD